MLKSIFVLLLGVLSLNLAQAQEENTNIYTTPASDFFMLHLQTDLWNDMPDSIQKSSYSPSVGLYLNKEFPINKSKLSVSLGVGVATTNNFLKKRQSINLEADSGIVFMDSAKVYGKYKYSQVFLEVPLELRYYQNTNNKNKGFKAALGLKVGNLVSAYTKGKYTSGGNQYKEKHYSRRFAERWRMVPYLRIGWGNYTLMGSYQITSVYQLNEGPQVFPYSLGFCISGL